MSLPKAGARISWLVMQEVSRSRRGLQTFFYFLFLIFSTKCNRQGLCSGGSWCCPSATCDESLGGEDPQWGWEGLASPCVYGNISSGGDHGETCVWNEMTPG